MPRVLAFAESDKRGRVTVSDEAGRTVAVIISGQRGGFEAVDAAGSPLCRGAGQGGLSRRWQVRDPSETVIATLDLRPTGTVRADLPAHGSWSINWVSVGKHWELRGPGRRVALRADAKHENAYLVTCHDDALSTAEIVGVAEAYRATARVRRYLRRAGALADLATGLQP